MLRRPRPCRPGRRGRWCAGEGGGDFPGRILPQNLCCTFFCSRYSSVVSCSSPTSSTPSTLTSAFTMISNVKLRMTHFETRDKQRETGTQVKSVLPGLTSEWARLLHSYPCRMSRILQCHVVRVHKSKACCPNCLRIGTVTSNSLLHSYPGYPCPMSRIYNSYTRSSSVLSGYIRHKSKACCPD